MDELAAATYILSRDAPFDTSAYRSIGGPDLSGSRRVMLASAEEHRLLRQALLRALSHRRVERWAAEIFRPAAQKFAGLLPTSSCFDVAEAFAGPYSRKAVYELIGLNTGCGDRLVAAYQQAHQAAVNPAMAGRLGPSRRVLDRIAHDVLLGEAMPSEATLAGHLRRFRLCDTRLDDAYVVLLILPLIEALAVKVDRDVVSSSLTALASLDRAGQQRVRTEEIFEGAVHEALRLQRGTVLPRAASADCEISLGGVPVELRRGRRVLLDVEKTNRDPLVFADPEPSRYAPWRTMANRSLSFGQGLHHCPGQALAVSLAVEACRAVLAHGWLRAASPDGSTMRVHLVPWALPGPAYQQESRSP